MNLISLLFLSVYLTGTAICNSINAKREKRSLNLYWEGKTKYVSRICLSLNCGGTTAYDHKGILFQHMEVWQRSGLFYCNGYEARDSRYVDCSPPELRFINTRMRFSRCDTQWYHAGDGNYRLIFGHVTPYRNEWNNDIAYSGHYLWVGGLVYDWPNTFDNWTPKNRYVCLTTWRFNWSIKENFLYIWTPLSDHLGMSQKWGQREPGSMGFVNYSRIRWTSVQVIREQDYDPFHPDIGVLFLAALFTSFVAIAIM